MSRVWGELGLVFGEILPLEYCIALIPKTPLMLCVQFSCLFPPLNNIVMCAHIHRTQQPLGSGKKLNKYNKKNRINLLYFTAYSGHSPRRLGLHLLECHLASHSMLYCDGRFCCCRCLRLDARFFFCLALNVCIVYIANKSNRVFHVINML